MIKRDESFVILGFACADNIRGIKEKLEAPKLLEVAAVKIERGEIDSHFSSFIAIDGYDAHDIFIDIPNIEAYGVMEEHLIGAPSMEEVAKEVCTFANGCAPVAIPSCLGTAGIFAEHAKRYGLAFDRPVRQFGEVFPIRREFKDGTPMTEVFSAYEIFLMDDSFCPNVRRDLLTWTLSYARLALALMGEEEDAPDADTSDASKEEFDRFIETFTENEGAMSAICAADKAYFRREYGHFCGVRNVRAEGARDLIRKLNERGKEHDAYIAVLRIPSSALEEIVRGLDFGDRPALIGTIRSDRFEAVIGCYKKT